MVRPFFILCTLLLCLAQPLLAADVTAIADRDRIGTGESLNLELRIEGKSSDDPDLSVLNRDWDILSRSSSSQTQIINGHLSRSKSINLTLMAKRSGELEIPSICFGQDCTSALPITVSALQQVATQGDELLLIASAEPQQVVGGEQIQLTLKVMHRVNLAGASLSDVDLQGVPASIQQVGEDSSYQTQRDGYRYNVVERRYLIYPEQAGTLTIPALTLQAQVGDASRFSNFGTPVRTLRRFSDEIAITVTDKPAGTGTNWIPASQLTLQDSWQDQPPQFKVGEPVTRTITLTASGLPAAHLPELNIPVPQGWKSYPDQPSRNDVKDSGGLTGIQRQKIAVVPTQAGKVTLPELELEWYDTSANTLRTARIPALTVEVAPGSAVVAVPQPRQPAPLAVEPQQPVEQTQAQPAAVAEQTSPPVTSVGYWPWVSLGLALGWLISLLLWWRSTRRRPLAAVHAEAPQLATGTEKKALKQLRLAIKGSDPKTIREAFIYWAGSHWPEEKVINLEQLQERVSTELAEELRRLNQALYAPESSAWDASRLEVALQSWIKQQEKQVDRNHALADLYPKSTK